MKAYLFNEETGLYEGETFSNTGTLDHESGLTKIPPPDFASGQIPVFDYRNKTWVVIPTNIARQLLKDRITRMTETTA